jgi:pantoate--beta-alanine ligase
MRTVDTVEALRGLLAGARGAAFVPTMGGLHPGHLALVARARELGSPVVASIFVNRLQFAAGEDFDRYPRTLTDDAAALSELGCDILFAPAEDVLYPEPQSVLVQPPPEAEQLCGEHRPGHFAGVLTVVCKLLNLVQPAVAVFGEKDFQQLWLVRRMVAQLAMPTRIVGHPTLRAADGLALSSRNRYLSATERAQAPQLYAALCQARDAIVSGVAAGRATREAAQGLSAGGWGVDYIELRDADTLRLPQSATGDRVLLGAAFLGSTRLIDSLPFRLA